MRKRGEDGSGKDKVPMGEGGRIEGAVEWRVDGEGEVGKGGEVGEEGGVGERVGSRANEHRSRKAERGADKTGGGGRGGGGKLKEKGEAGGEERGPGWRMGG